MACRSASENLVGGAPSPPPMDSEDGAGEGGTGSSPGGGAAAAGSAMLLPEGGDVVGGSSLSSSSGLDGLAFFEGEVDWSFREDVYTRRGGLALLITTGGGPRTSDLVGFL